MKTNKKKNIQLFVLNLFLLLGIGYAALTANLKINGTINVDKATWDVHFENVNITEGSVEANPAPTTNNIDTTEMTYTINFTKPGDFFEFTTDMVNNGTIDAMVNSVTNKTYNVTGTSEIEKPTYLINTVAYDDGMEIQQNHLLTHGTSEKIKVRIEFKKDITASDLPSSGDTTVVFKFKGDFKQADENAIHSRINIDLFNSGKLDKNVKIDSRHFSGMITDEEINYYYIWVWSTSPSDVYYTDKITVLKGEKLKITGKVAVWYNCTSHERFTIGFSDTSSLNEDFVESTSMSGNFKNPTKPVSLSVFTSNLRDFEVNITKPGQYYVKSILTQTTYSCSAYAAITELKLRYY